MEGKWNFITFIHETYSIDILFGDNLVQVWYTDNIVFLSILK